MKLYGYIALNEKTKDGFVMPIFQKNDGTLFFQSVEMDKTIALVTLDLKRDTCAAIRKYEKNININLKEDILAYLDDGKVYIGNKYYVYNMAKRFKSYEKYKESFIYLGKEIEKERKEELKLANEKLEKVFKIISERRKQERMNASSIKATINGITVTIPRGSNPTLNQPNSYKMQSKEARVMASLLEDMNKDDKITRQPKGWRMKPKEVRVRVLVEDGKEEEIILRKSKGIKKSPRHIPSARVAFRKAQEEVKKVETGNIKTKPKVKTSTNKEKNV